MMLIVSLVAHSSRTFAFAWSVIVRARVAVKLSNSKEAADQQTGMNLGSKTSLTKDFCGALLPVGLQSPALL